MHLSLRNSLSFTAIAIATAGCGDEPPLPTVGSVSQAAVVCADGDTLEGIDVSYYQGVVDWEAVANDGISFGIARVNHGDFIDPEFETNWQAIRDHGLIRGAYQYFDPGGDPEVQATTFIDYVGTLEPTDLPGVLDLESHDGLTPSQVAANAKIWLDLVEAGTGRRPIIYTGSYFWNDHVATAEFNDHALWIAHYETNCPNLPTAWQRWAMWQYSGSGSVDGIAGPVDRNEFNGTVEDLNDLAANGYRAEVVSYDASLTLEPGETAEVELVVNNLGARAWSAETYLATSDERDRTSAFASSAWVSENRVVSIGEVSPGESVTVTFELTAPSSTGQFLEHFNLVQEGVAWFSDISPGGGPMDDEIAIDILVSSQGSPPTGAPPSFNTGGGGIPSTGVASGCTVSASPSTPANRGWGLGAAFMLLIGGWRRRCR